MEKTAKHDTSVTIEKQLDEAKFTGERQDPKGDRIIEKMIDSEKEVNDTSSESPQKRKEKSYEYITEKQLEKLSDGFVARWGDKELPSVITEAQWKEVHRAVGSVLSKDQSTIITEKQLEDFLSKHRYVPHEVITEKQLKTDGSDLSRWAYRYDANKLVKVAMDVLSDAIASYKQTPQDLLKAASVINDSVENKTKAVFLTLLNSLPFKKENVLAERNRQMYFSKTASIQSLNPMD